MRIDKIMEKFGWPMGPAYLMDVVGIDTGHHGRDVMAEGFPDRMKDDRRSAVDVLYEAKRLGQKNGKGFYAYETDKRGKQKKVADSSVLEVLKPIVYEQREVTDEDIINWMMIPLCLETVRCLEDGIVETAAEADMGLVYGIGFLHSVAVRCATSIRSVWLSSLPWLTSTLIWARCTTRPRSCVKWPRTARASSVKRPTTRAREHL